MGIVAEFARYKAKLVNHLWAVSALTDTELVASLWEHRIKVVDGQWIYQDQLSRRICDVKFTQTRAGSKLKIQRTILKVHDHKDGYDQMEFDLGVRDE